MIIGKYNPTCFQPNFNMLETPFADAFALSWTTFTTVVGAKFLCFLDIYLFVCHYTFEFL